MFNVKVKGLILIIKYRVAEYADYLAEEQMNNGFEIAPDCKGSRSGGRCTFGEFLMHIWGGKQQPKGYKTWPKDIDKAIASGNTKLAVESLANAEFDITKPKKPTEHQKPTSVIDTKKLWPKYKQLSYGDVLALKGSKSAQLKGVLKAPTDSQKNIINLGLDSVEAVHELRYEDNEKFRISALNKDLPYEVKTKPYTMRTMKRTFNQLDISRTALGTKGARDEILKSINKYNSAAGKPQGHFKVIQAARLGRMRMTCPLVLKL